MLVAPRYEESAYDRRVPEQELLHQVLVAHLETFLDRTHTEGSEMSMHRRGLTELTVHKPSICSAARTPDQAAPSKQGSCV